MLISIQGIWKMPYIKWLICYRCTNTLSSLLLHNANSSPNGQWPLRTFNSQALFYLLKFLFSPYKSLVSKDSHYLHFYKPGNGLNSQTVLSFKPTLNITPFGSLFVPMVKGLSVRVGIFSSDAWLQGGCSFVFTEKVIVPAFPDSCEDGMRFCEESSGNRGCYITNTR